MKAVVIASLDMLMEADEFGGKMEELAEGHHKMHQGVGMDICSATFLDYDAPFGTIKNVDVTIPTNLNNNSQRHVGNDTSVIVGPNMLRMINEPTATINKASCVGEENVPFFALGDWTFDVSFLTIEKCVFQVKETTVRLKLVEGAFTNNMVNHFIQLF